MSPLQRGVTRRPPPSNCPTSPCHHQLPGPWCSRQYAPSAVAPDSAAAAAASAAARWCCGEKGCGEGRGAGDATPQPRRSSRRRQSRWPTTARRSHPGCGCYALFRGPHRRPVCPLHLIPPVKLHFIFPSSLQPDMTLGCMLQKMFSLSKGKFSHLT